MQSLENRKADRARRLRLAEREMSPATKELKPQEQLDYNEMTVAELREVISARDLKPEGTKKAELIAALEAADQQGKSSEEEPVKVSTSGIPPVQPWTNPS